MDFTALIQAAASVADALEGMVVEASETTSALKKIERQIIGNQNHEAATSLLDEFTGVFI